MTEENPESTGTAEDLLQTLRAMASDAATRETIVELGARARSVVEGLARATQAAGGAGAGFFREDPEGAGPDRDEETPGEAAATASPQAWRRMQRDVEAARAGVAEVADLLEAVLERLESLEEQLGEPGEKAGARLVAGVEACERVLAGIERALARREDVAAEKGQPAIVRTVLVVAAGSAQRAGLCIELERQGLRTIAVEDPSSALRTASRRRAEVAVLVAPAQAGAAADLTDAWRQAAAEAPLPPAVLLLGDGNAEAVCDPDVECVLAQHGMAALAAALDQVARRNSEEPTT